MILYLIIDLDNTNWQFLNEPQKVLNDLILLINIFVKPDYLNQVYIICNKKIIFNTKQASLNYILSSFTNTKSSLSQDLGYVLCLANKTKIKSRIFVFSLHETEPKSCQKKVDDIGCTGDVRTIDETGSTRNATYTVKEKISEQNINLIKCAFVAEKLKIRIDAIALFGNEKLKQACYATGGMFCFDERDTKNFIINVFCGGKVEIPYFGVKCFCHDKDIMLGLVCPICLAIYCKFIPICRQCKTKMSFDK
ncbi:RNA polymerase II transcription factor B subunit 4 [Binucleata daphniae]